MPPAQAPSQKKDSRRTLDRPWTLTAAWRTHPELAAIARLLHSGLGRLSTQEHRCHHEGGVASGVIYPLALCELAREFRLRNVGGASAGAIAESLAAAELGRARTTGTQNPYRPLASSPKDQTIQRSLPSWLSGSRRHDRLARSGRQRWCQGGVPHRPAVQAIRVKCRSSGC